MKIILVPERHECEDAEWLRDELYDKIVNEEVDIVIDHNGHSIAEEVAERLIKKQHNGNNLSFEEIKRFCEEAEKQFLDAPIRVFVPVLVENIVARKLDDKEKVKR